MEMVMLELVIQHPFLLEGPSWPFELSPRRGHFPERTTKCVRTTSHSQVYRDVRWVPAPKSNRGMRTNCRREQEGNSFT